VGNLRLPKSFSIILVSGFAFITPNAVITKSRNSQSAKFKAMGLNIATTRMVLIKRQKHQSRVQIREACLERI